MRFTLFSVSEIQLGYEHIGVIEAVVPGFIPDVPRDTVETQDVIGFGLPDGFQDVIVAIAASLHAVDCCFKFSQLYQDGSDLFKHGVGMRFCGAAYRRLKLWACLAIA
jgi:hypothetical protein